MMANGWDWSRGPPGPTWTLMDNLAVVGIGGAIQGEGGAWMAWSCLSSLPLRDWPRAVRLAGEAIDTLLQRGDVRWLWAQCRTESPAAARVLRRLGFRPHHVEHVEALGLDVACMLREG